MSREHLFLSPGKSDVFSLLEWYINTAFGSAVQVHIYRVGWRNNRESYEQKMEKFLDVVNKVADQFGPVSLGGISASGSFMLNAYMEMPDKIKKVISVCGRLRVGKGVFPPMDLAAIGSHAFYESVVCSEENQRRMTEGDRRKFMTLSALFDEQVPHSTSTLTGARNLKIPMIGHIFSQAYAIRKMDKEIINFLNC